MSQKLQPRLVDLVQVSKKFTDGWSNKKEAIIVHMEEEHYNVEDRREITDIVCTLFFQNDGEVSWFPISQLKVLKRNQHVLLKKWQKDFNKRSER